MAHAPSSQSPPSPQPAADLPKLAEAGGLAGPKERPQAEVVIYDGHCRFCTAQVRRLAALDWGRRLAFLSLHDPSVARDYPDLTFDQLMEELYLIRRDGQRLAGAAAFRYLTRRLPLLWPLAPIMHLPFSLPLWSWCYRQIARRRYWFGRTDECDGGTCAVHFGRQSGKKNS